MIRHAISVELFHLSGSAQVSIALAIWENFGKTPQKDITLQRKKNAQKKMENTNDFRKKTLENHLNKTLH